ncbi:uncharacterized protein B0H18DRAFT_1028469 [Fomitopsis serialis]|uniref:uncharacterized protein n=1 Tax=Fomitopsis serialis TaxID=139415 RepID=UPI002008B3B4|nr:uncharacterized protein B0H18DRAFT_1028469 [Neoantrodia serialis]KAH9919343.1 hypothetical protein B0H18DRAFT_1028469 [Neoantrodia serialis]
MLTGVYDASSVESMPHILAANAPNDIGETVAAHILQIPPISIKPCKGVVSQSIWHEFAHCPFTAQLCRYGIGCHGADTPNTYTPKSTLPMYRQRIYQRTSLYDPGSRSLPLPARVAHLSGAGEYIEKMSSEMEETSVLSNDGSSAHLLAAALHDISVD